MGDIKQFLNHLSGVSRANDSVFSRFKLKYRAHICPFDDLINLIPQKSSVCDVGCGEGVLLLIISKFSEPKKIAGLDINQKVVKIAKERLNGCAQSARIEPFNGFDLPDWLSEYNFFTMIDVLHHVPYPRQRGFLLSLIGKMKPGDTLLLKDICRKKIPWVYFNKLHDLIVAKEFGSERSSIEVGSWFADLAPEVEVVSTGYKRTIVYPHYWYMVKKK